MTNIMRRRRPLLFVIMIFQIMIMLRYDNVRNCKLRNFISQGSYSVIKQSIGILRGLHSAKIKCIYGERKFWFGKQEKRKMKETQMPSVRKRCPDSHSAIRAVQRLTDFWLWAVMSSANYLFSVRNVGKRKMKETKDNKNNKYRATPFCNN